MKVNKGSGLLQLLAFGLAGLLLPVAHATDGTLWRDLKASQIQAVGERLIKPVRARTFAMDPDSLTALLRQAPDAAAGLASRPLLTLPLPDGREVTFALSQSEVMQPGLAAAYPMIRTYTGTASTDAMITGRFQMDPRGFRGMVFTSKGTVYIDPYTRGDNRFYQSYFTQDMPARRRPHDEVLPAQQSLASAKSRQQATSLLPETLANRGVSIAGDMRTYRLALAATYQYSAFHDPQLPPNLPSKAVVLAELVNVVNRVSGVYERDLGIRLVLIDGNDAVIFNTPVQPYADADGTSMVVSNTNILNTFLGNASNNFNGNSRYDIGHVASTGGGGVAYLGCVCASSNKGGGVTGLPEPIGDAYYIDFVAHEMGHQFGANHTFNGDAGSCSGNRNAGTAYEPGSGITIMAYAGICSDQNIAAHSIDTFHAASFDEIVAYSRTGNGNSCPVKTSSSNNPPVVVTPASGFSIPKQTPFMLTGSATDPDGDVLTYQWEEMDKGAAGAPNAAATNMAPLFRPFLPSSSPTRVFPQVSDIVGNTQTIGEILPNIARTLNFRLTVRDNKMYPESGGVGSADLSFNISAAAGPFQVTAPNTVQSFSGGQVLPVTWDVANTTAAPVSCANVDIALSTDGGYTFPTLLASAVPNNGSFSVALPQVSTAEGRIRVKCSNNIFFDISNANFSINKEAPVLALPTSYENPDVDGAFGLSWVRPAGASGPDTVQESSNCGPSFVDDASERLSAGSNSKWSGSLQWQSMSNAADGSDAYFIPDLVLQDESLTQIDAIAVPLGATASVSFTTRQGLENGYDFGHVEVQADGGAWETLASYTGPAGATTPQTVFDGVRTIDLSAYQGKSVRLRFRLETDAYTVGVPAGWYIDNIAVTVTNFTDLATVSGTSHAVAGHAIGSYCYRVRSAYALPTGLSPSLDSNVVGVNIASTNLLPLARVVPSTNSGNAPLAVSFDASSSSDPDGDAIAAYTFDFGDGSDVLRQASALANHSYNSAGSYTVRVSVTDARGASSAEPATTVIEVLSTVSDPTPFTFAERTNVPVNTFVSSEGVVMSGYSGTLPISVDNSLQYSINGGAYTNVAGEIASGARLNVRHVSAATEGTAKESQVTVGGYQAVFRSVTTTVDRVPDDFSFGSKSEQEPNTLVSSDIQTLTGYDEAVVVAGPGIQYRINGGTWTSARGTLVSGQTLQVQHTTSSSSLGYTKTYLKVGGVTGYFTTRTKK